MMDDICRLCGDKSESMVFIFDDLHSIRDIHSKIAKVLQIEVGANDSLPKKICDGCHIRLNDAFHFINSCQNTQNRLKEFLDASLLLPHISHDLSRSYSCTEVISINVEKKYGIAVDGEDSPENTKTYLKTGEKTITRPVGDSANAKSNDSMENENESSIHCYNLISINNEDKYDTREKKKRRQKRYPTPENNFDRNVGVKIKKKMFLKKRMLKSQGDTIFSYRNREEEKMKWICATCQMTFTQELMYQEHLNVHTGSRPYACKLCEACFRKRQELNQHIRTVHSDKQYKCSICDHIAKHKGKLTEHIKSVHEKPFACDLCAYRTGEKGKIQQHIANKHNGDLSFVCEICGNCFRTRPSLQAHRMNIHFPEPKVCQICGTVCPSLARYSAHIFRCGKEKKRYPCETCGKSYVNKEILKDHMNKHLNIKPYKCDVCGKDFYQRNRLDTHKYVHRGLAYQCEVCNQLFNRKDNMKNHMKKHFYKPLRCDNTIVTAV